MSNDELLISGFINNFEKITNNKITIPYEIHQLCYLFYTKPQLIFVKQITRKSKNGNQIAFKIINPTTKFISKSIILTTPVFLKNQSLCYIPNISNRINMSSDIIENLGLDFQNYSYDAFFCINSNEYPSFIFFKSKDIHNSYNQIDINATLWMSSLEISSPYKYHSFKLHKNEIIATQLMSDDSCLKPNVICILKLDDVEDKNFRFVENELDPIIPTRQPFIPQPEISYTAALDVVLNDKCFISAYDEKIGCWRPAKYHGYHFDDGRKIMFRYSQWRRPIVTIKTKDDYRDLSIPCFMYNITKEYDSKLLLKKFPLKCIRLNDRLNVYQSKEISKIPFYTTLKYSFRYGYLCSDHVNLICFQIGYTAISEIYYHKENTIINSIDAPTVIDMYCKNNILWFDNRNKNILYGAFKLQNDNGGGKHTIHIYKIDLRKTNSKQSKNGYKWAFVHELSTAFIDHIFD